MKQLSGGERRRIALALALAFGDLAAARGRLKCNLMVLDEVWHLSALFLAMALKSDSLDLEQPHLYCMDSVKMTSSTEDWA